MIRAFQNCIRRYRDRSAIGPLQYFVPILRAPSNMMLTAKSRVQTPSALPSRIAVISDQPRHSNSTVMIDPDRAQ